MPRRVCARALRHLLFPQPLTTCRAQPTPLPQPSTLRHPKDAPGGPVRLSPNLACALRGLTLGVLLTLMTGCLHRPPPPAAPQTAAPLLDSVQANLSNPELSVKTRYLLLSAAVGLGRTLRQDARLDALLAERAQQEPDRGLALLSAFWQADNALYSGRLELAAQRYRTLLSTLALDRTQREQPWMLMDIPLTEWISSQLEAAEASQGHLEVAAQVYLTYPARSEPFRNLLRLRAERQALRAGRGTLASTLRIPVRPLDLRLDTPPSPAPPAVRTPESLGFLAPWQADIWQRAGAIGRGVGPTVRGFGAYLFRQRSHRGCGLYTGGYWYDSGSHKGSLHGGRDAYAIDFTGAPARANPYGHGSFGIQLAAAAEGVVGMVYYGTPTHHGIRTPGPLPENNRVQLYHLPLEQLSFEQLMHRWEARRLGPHYPPRPLAFQDLWDYQSVYLHLVGLQNPCGQEKLGVRLKPCIPDPAQVSPGQYVWQGTPLGYEDSTGYSWANHLHYQVNVTCRAPGVTCAQPSHRFSGVSIPVPLEGLVLQKADLGTCVGSTNRPALSRDENRDGRPDPLQPLLP